MDRLLYLGMMGAKDVSLAQAQISNNLANASVPGFRSDLLRVRSLPIYGPGQPTRVANRLEPAGSDLSTGTLTPTGRDLDIAVDGEGWIAVQAPDGREAYTRSGDLRVNSVGLLVNGAGHPVLGEGGPIAIPPAESIEIAADGTISARLVGERATGMVVLDRIRLVSAPADAVVKGLDGLFRLRAGAQAVADAQVRVIPRTLESSNVSSVGAMADLIGLARSFEVQVRLMKAAEENDSVSSQLLRMG